jgi:hypothetical protein
VDTFFLGTHRPNWLETVPVPLFVSQRQLTGRRRLPRAAAPWALDSGGFSEITLFGTWQTTAVQYVKDVRRYVDEIGSMQWAAIMDWMVEDFMLRKTGKTKQEHQRLTLENYEELLNLAPEIPWMPVLQGWDGHEYLEHLAMYERRGLPIHDRVVGIGSVCRRKTFDEAAGIIRQLAIGHRVRLHGFGVKGAALRLLAPYFASSDSMAWSYNARRNPPLPDCTHKRCANCRLWALRWHDRLLRDIAPANAQLVLL